MRDPNCIFCKIIGEEIPSTVVYEDQWFRAILDVSPAARGHVIILTKNHVPNLYDLPEEEASRIMIVAKRIACALKKAYHCDGVNILQNNGEAAGQTVFHFHVHVIPRFRDDSINIKWEPGSMPEDPAVIADEIRANMKREG